MIVYQHEKDRFVIPAKWTVRVKGAPDRKYAATAKEWHLPNNPANRRFVLSNFLGQEFTPTAMEAVTAPPAAIKSSSSAMPVWPPDLLPHQLEALNLSWGKSAFFFAHAMGSGKSRTILELWRGYFNAGLITEAWVICPNSLIGNWEEQIARWTPDIAGRVQIYGILSLSAGKLPGELVKRSHARLAVAVDESQRIKNAQARRTKVMHSIGVNAGYRANLTGTNVTKGIEDLYSQYNFLDPNILGYTSFYSFRNHYCVMGGFENKQIVGYRNMADLMQLIAPHTHLVTDPVKLPPQTREERLISLTAEQKRLLGELKDQMQTEMAGEKLTVTNALAYYTRGAQILGGFFPAGEGRLVLLKDNNKLDELMEIMAGTDKKVVVFCKFVAEANLIMGALDKAGIETRQIKANDPHLQQQVQDFQTNPDVRCIVSTYAMGSVGFTLTAGKILVEYSGTFNFEESVQARKRIDRIGQEEETKVIRLLANSKLDRAIRDIADKKQSIADYVTNSLSDPKALLNIME